MRVVQDVVGDGVGRGCHSEIVGPLSRRRPGRDDGRAIAVTVLEDLEDIGALLVRERGQPQSSMSRTSMQARLPSSRTQVPSAPGESEVVQEAWRAAIVCANALCCDGWL